MSGNGKCVLILPKPLPTAITGHKKVLKTAIPRMTCTEATKTATQKIEHSTSPKNISVLQPILPKLPDNARHSKDKIIIPVTVKNSDAKPPERNSSHPIIRMNSGLPSKNLPSQVAVVNVAGSSFSVPDSVSHGIELDEPLNVGIVNELPETAPPSVYCNSKQKLCQICGKFLKSSSSLKSHLVSHNPESPHICHVCGKGFKFRNRLVCHLRTHSLEKPYTCDVCQMSFTSSSNLKRHKNVHLTPNKQFLCSICRKRFSSAKSLNSHSRMHKKEEISCDICGKNFPSASSLQSHSKHHSKNAAKYSCHLCSKSYFFESLLEKHLDGHRGVKRHHCTICPAKFVWRSSLTSHIQTHSEKEYSCTLCLASFYSEKKLKYHLEKHVNPTPHECSVCSKSFAYKFQLKKHVSKMHSNNNPPNKIQVKLKAPKIDNEDEFTCDVQPNLINGPVDPNEDNLNKDKDHGAQRLNPYHQLHSPQYATITPLQTYGTPYQENKTYASTPANRNLINTTDPYLNNSLRGQSPPNILFNSPCQTYNSYLPVVAQEEDVSFTPLHHYEEHMPVLDLSLI